KSERNEQNRRLSPCTRRPPLPAQTLGVQRTQKISGSRNRKNSQALSGSAPPNGINGGVVQEWHRAVNWMICYGAEDDWDQVGTDT
ncbi:MAG: DUF4272 domain-containing protein, partial [Betaproteobacteria bacterium]